MGHPEGYTATDIIARFKARAPCGSSIGSSRVYLPCSARTQRMKGYNVLHPMGWDAFGLPAEQYALDTGTHPNDTTRKNIDRFRQQLKVETAHPPASCSPDAFSAVPWLFLRLGAGAGHL